MKVIVTNPAQRQLVHKFIDWEIVGQRLQRFPAIGRAFPIELLRSRRETPPYYCHYMAWRLGTWTNESLFERFNELLTKAEILPYWYAEAPLLKSPNFSDFWSLDWQLQVAEYLCDIGTGVQWAKSGPDLSVEIESEKWYVECYTYRKSFGLMLFIEEILQQIDNSICVEYDLCLPFSLPRNDDSSQFIDSVMSTFLDPENIERAKARARNQYPVFLYKDKDSSLVIYVEGEDINAYKPNTNNAVGDPKHYLEKVAIQEAIKAKMNANSLNHHRPNLLVVNYLLSMDAQLGLNRTRDDCLTVPFSQLKPKIDALAIAAVGIDKPIEGLKLKLVAVAPEFSRSVALNTMTDSI